MLPEVAIIIPAYNHWDYVIRCALSALKHTPQCHIEIVDDASPERPNINEIAANFHGRNVHLTMCHKNEGMTRAWNVGLRHARQHGIEYVVCGNSDLLFVPWWWEWLREGLTKYNFVGPMTNAPGHMKWQDVRTVMPSYGNCDKDGYLDYVAECLSLHEGTGEDMSDAPSLNGFCFAGRTDDFWKAAYDPLHVFNPMIPMAGNEDDFFRRATGKGMKTGVCRRSFVFHYRSVTRGLKGKKIERGAYRSPSIC